MESVWRVQASGPVHPRDRTSKWTDDVTFSGSWSRPRDLKTSPEDSADRQTNKHSVTQSLTRSRLNLQAGSNKRLAGGSLRKACLCAYVLYMDERKKSATGNEWVKAASKHLICQQRVCTVLGEAFFETLQSGQDRAGEREGGREDTEKRRTSDTRTGWVWSSTVLSTD